MMNLLVKDVARLLNVSDKTVYRWVQQGALPAYRVNDQVRFNRAEILEWATSRRMPVSPDIYREPEGSSSMPTVAEALKEGGIQYRIEGANKAAVLASVVEHLRLPVEVDRSFLLSVLLAREELSSTGIGDGIAIPHVRNPIVLHVETPQINLSFLESPVDFGSLDGKPVKALFTLISPTVRAHLHLLSRLAYLLRDPGFKELVRREGLREELLGRAREIEATVEKRDQEKRGMAR